MRFWRKSSNRNRKCDITGQVWFFNRCVSSRPCCWSSSGSISWGTTRPPWRLPACPSPSQDIALSPGPSRLQPRPPPSRSAFLPLTLRPNLTSPQVTRFMIIGFFSSHVWWNIRSYLTFWCCFLVCVVAVHRPGHYCLLNTQLIDDGDCIKVYSTVQRCITFSVDIF